HRSVEQGGDMNLVNTNSSSTSKIIYDLISHCNDEGMVNKDRTSVLDLGIIDNTGRCLFKNSSEHTMELAGKIIGHDIDHNA
ncbi:oligoribonuclease, partial [Staphylococcus aureus]